MYFTQLAGDFGEFFLANLLQSTYNLKVEMANVEIKKNNIAFDLLVYDTKGKIFRDDKRVIIEVKTRNRDNPNQKVNLVADTINIIGGNQKKKGILWFKRIQKRAKEFKCKAWFSHVVHSKGDSKIYIFLGPVDEIKKCCTGDGFYIFNYKYAIKNPRIHVWEFNYKKYKVPFK